jgi:hypothetical protein
MKWDINLQNIQDEYTMLTTVFILIIAKLYIDMKIKSNTGSKRFG